ncbi:MAG TPA: arsenate reductase (glutaredoxin) [Xanthomonadaceae bacterium]|nr:arsenate reductase (glutaredoxin) [Xanthomonadaceae bacterium]
MLYHNPRCSKSRATLELLRQSGVAPRVVEYLDTPPDAAELDAVLRRLGMEPREFMRRQEPEYAGLGLDDPALTRGQLVAAMVAHPRLIQRPVLVVGDRARIGRPPERVLEIL